MNRLAHESSPYLQQHASNPVDWFPWGEEAIALATQRDCPIFLSIGYSACHWCHVMEHESFDNRQIADLMNQNFICIKVDREERPDLDQIYMNSVMALTGHGGWPMSVFLTPKLEPFFCGTYWPPDARMNMPGFRQILTKIRAAWDERRGDINDSAGQLAEAVVQLSRPQGAQGAADISLLKSAQHALLNAFDSRHGGFGDAPKFPHPMDLRVLMRCWRLFNNDDALNAVRVSCDRMAAGGIYDHLGGGFHRYATDARWLVPHFEKMLYDNGLLTSVYAEVLQITGADEYRRVLTETIDYIRREMTTADGGFCSAQDADSEGEEGRFFVWSRSEATQVLGEESAAVFCDAYDVSERGNWEGKNILNRPRPFRQVADDHGLSRDELESTLSRMKQQLFDVRSRRVAPGTDDKVIAAWNGMMISGIATAARVLHRPDAAELAAAAADYVLRQMTVDDGRLWHTARRNRATIPAFLDDYACCIDALVELYQTTFDERRIGQAVLLADLMLQDFADSNDGGFFYTAADQSTPITRIKDSQDGATPSGNAMAATALLKLAALTDRADFQSAAESALRLLDGQLRRSPMSGGQSLIAADHLLGPGVLVVIQTTSRFADSQMLRLLTGRFAPGMLLACRSTTDETESSGLLNHLFESRDAPTTGEIAWVCQRGSCLAPVSTDEQLAAALDQLLPLPG